MRLIFMGTPQFAVPSLERLISSHHQVLAVVSQPDRERDRKGNLIYPPAKQCALQNGIKVLQFSSLKNDGVEALSALEPDIMVTAAYGQILSQQILDIPRHGVINVHASLLPKYRGSSPIQWSIIDGEEETGVTIMQTALGLDTGDIISAAATKIGSNETAGELSDRLSILGADLLLETLDKIQNQTAIKIPQNDALATKCSMIKKSDGLIDWTKPARVLKNFIHGNNPWPVAHSYLHGKRINIFRAEEISASNVSIPNKPYQNGEIVFQNGEFVVAAGQGTFLKLVETQVQGKNKMKASEMLKGLRLAGGEGFGNEG